MKNLYFSLVTVLAYSFVKHRTIGWVFYSRLLLIALVTWFLVFYR